MAYKVFITSQIPEIARDMVAEVAEVEQWQGEEVLTYADLVRKARDKDGLFCLLANKVDVGLLDAATRLKVISNYAVGFDNIDVAAATRRGIPVGNTPGVLSETTADLAFALLMAAAREIPQSDQFVRGGEWKTAWRPTLKLGQDIHHATLGIIGMGRIGCEMARRGKGFHMRILYYSHRRYEEMEKELDAEPVSLEKLMAESDFVSLHVPLNEQTRNLIGRQELALMKPTAFIINTARGAVIDQRALYEALKSGKIAGAGLDVYEREPLDINDPLLKLKNVVFTPHIGSATTATRTKMAVMAAENLIAGLQGKRLPHCVNPDVYSKTV